MINIVKEVINRLADKQSEQNEALYESLKQEELNESSLANNHDSNDNYTNGD
jgi:hypothetical protein